MVAVGGAVAPMLKRFAESVGENIAAVRNWVQENGALLGQVLKYGTLLLGAGVAMVTFGKAIAGVATAFQLARAAMIAFSTHPLIAILTAVAAGTLLIVHKFATETDDVTGELTKPADTKKEDAAAERRAKEIDDEDVQRGKRAVAFYRENPQYRKRLEEDAVRGQVYAKTIVEQLKREEAKRKRCLCCRPRNRQRVATLNERLQNELHRLKIESIQDEYQRELASINATYDEKVRAAEKAGADIELVEMARRERLAQQDTRQDRRGRR